jgi:hypothetical protein
MWPTTSARYIRTRRSLTITHKSLLVLSSCHPPSFRVRPKEGERLVPQPLTYHLLVALQATVHATSSFLTCG